jgi:hypothetical protein
MRDGEEDFSLTNFNGFCRDSRNSVGKAENLSGKTKFCRETQSIHCETAIDSPVVQLIIPLPWPDRTTILPEREAKVFQTSYSDGCNVPPHELIFTDLFIFIKCARIMHIQTYIMKKFLQQNKLSLSSGPFLSLLRQSFRIFLPCKSIILC